MPRIRQRRGATRARHEVRNTRGAGNFVFVLYHYFLKAYAEFFNIVRDLLSPDENQAPPEFA